MNFSRFRFTKKFTIAEYAECCQQQQKSFEHFLIKLQNSNFYEKKVNIKNRQKIRLFTKKIEITKDKKKQTTEKEESKAGLIYEFSLATKK